jgi:hypothetical protein
LPDAAIYEYAPSSWTRLQAVDNIVSPVARVEAVVKY